MSSLQHRAGPQAQARHRSTEIYFRLESLERRQLLAHAPPWAHHGGGEDLTVMSQNLYLGCDIAKLAAAQSGMEVPGLVAQAWQTVQQTDFNARAKVIAKEIAKARPEIVGLQEAALWRVQEAGDYFLGNPRAATEVKYDFVQILTDELAKRGLKYKAVATVDLMDIELPDALPFGAYSDIRLTDRDVILARTDLPKSQFKITNPQSGQFAQTLPFSLGGSTINIPRGWTSVDARVGCKTVHVVESHTEAFSELVQIAQTNELLTGPANSTLPTVLIGDFNSDANVPQAAYSMIAGAGFEDAWTDTHKSAGLTWGHDETLRDAGGGFTQRLDLIMYKGKRVDARSMKVVDGAVPATAAGPLWASDHAGVFSTIEIGWHAPKHWCHRHGSFFDGKQDAATPAKDVLALVQLVCGDGASVAHSGGRCALPPSIAYDAPSMSDDAFQQVIDRLSRAKRVLITTHVKPDGDALGSTAAMSLALKHQGIDSQILLLSHLPRKYSFVYTDSGIAHVDVEAGWPGEEKDEGGRMKDEKAGVPSASSFILHPSSFDCLLVLDTGTWSQLPGLKDRIANWNVPKIVIDHHLTQEDWADVKLVDTKAGACGEIVEELLGKWGVPIDHKIASALFVAIVTDTGWFQYSNTRPQTLRLAADLMDVGVDTDRIQNLLYRNERAERVALHTRGLQNLEMLDDGRVAVIVLRKSDFADTKSSVNDTEDLINIPLQIRTVEVAALVTESPAGGPIRVSMRSKGKIDVAKFAEQFGGGGHARASGMKFATSLDAAHEKVVEALKRRMKDEG